MTTGYFGHPLSPVDDPEAPLWCADFDSDLLRLIPSVLDALGDTATRRLWTHCRPTNGKINSPTAWNDSGGLVSLFTVHEDRDPAPAGFWTNDPIIECTFLDAVRDEWLHGARIVADGHLIWTPQPSWQQALMYDARGWQPLSDTERHAIRDNVRCSLSIAVRDFRALFGTAAVS